MSPNGLMHGFLLKALCNHQWDFSTFLKEIQNKTFFLSEVGGKAERLEPI